MALALKSDKVVLGALANAAQYKGIRNMMSVVTSGLTSGKIKSFDDIGKVKGVQKIVEKFTLSERGLYKTFLTPIGFPEIAVQSGRVTGFVSKKAARIGVHGAFEVEDASINIKRIKKNLEQHIEYLKKESFFQKAHKQAKQMGMIERTKMSREWYHNYALEFGTNFRSMEMLREGGRRISDMRLGRMYFFRYRPIASYVTPLAGDSDNIYDEFPLLFMLYEDADNFSGINFHYLSPKLRAVLLGRMYEYLINQDFTDRTKLFAKKFRNVIKTNKRFRHAKVAYRQYRPEQIKSKVLQVHPLDWDLAITVPTERFKTAGGGRTASKKMWYKTAKRARTIYGSK